MEKRFPVRASLKVGSWACFSIFTFVMTLNYFYGIYRFGSAAYLAGTTGSLMGIYTYWRLWCKSAEEGGKMSTEDAVLKKHPLLVPTLRTGGYAACAVFTLFTVLSHLEGTPDFERAFVGAAIAGVVGLLEGYRRALRRHANRGDSEPERAMP
jgi:hypothetical protein